MFTSLDHSLARIQREEIHAEAKANRLAENIRSNRPAKSAFFSIRVPWMKKETRAESA